MCSHDTATQARKKEHARRQTTRTACQNMHARRLQAKTDERHWSGRQDARSFIHTCATQHQQPSTSSCSIDRAYLPSPLPSFCCLLLVFSASAWHLRFRAATRFCSILVATSGGTAGACVTPSHPWAPPAAPPSPGGAPAPPPGAALAASPAAAADAP